MTLQEVWRQFLTHERKTGESNAPFDDLLPVSDLFRLLRQLLRMALEGRTGCEMRCVGSNCGCGDPVEVERRFQDDRSISYFDLPMPVDFRSPVSWKRKLRKAARILAINEVFYGFFGSHEGCFGGLGASQAD